MERCQSNISGDGTLEDTDFSKSSKEIPFTFTVVENKDQEALHDNSLKMHNHLFMCSLLHN